jgi:hypothetical protein
MRFVRAMPHGEGAANLRTYECKECGVAATPAEDSAPTGKLQLGSIIASDNSPITNALLDHGFLSVLLTHRPFRTQINAI